MRKLFIAGTLVFWLALVGFWAAGFWFTEPAAESSGVSVNQPRYTLTELAAHNQANDCWMVINGSVYDFTPYLPEHPATPSMMLDWCGKEATQAFNSKTIGRPHSPYAVQLLSQYRIGELSEE